MIVNVLIQVLMTQFLTHCPLAAIFQYGQVTTIVMMQTIMKNVNMMEETAVVMRSTQCFAIIVNALIRLLMTQCQQQLQQPLLAALFLLG